MKVEREVKLGAWGGFELPELTDVVEGIEAKKLADKILDATYYDTRDLRLARSGVSLRHRAGDDPPWTVKLPEGDAGPIMNRKEITFAGPAGTLPPEALSLVRGYVRSATLEPIARLKTLRAGVELCSGDQRVAEVVDDEVSVYQGRRLTARFREVEVELDGDAPAGLLSAVVAELRRAGAGNTEAISKVSRALGPRASEPPDIRILVAAPGASMAEVVKAAIASGVSRMVAHDPGVRLGDDPEDVHQARVGTRRLRSDLRTFAPLLDRDWVRGLRDELGWYAALLGTVRDAEVLTERLEKQGKRLPPEDARGVKAIVARLSDDRDKGRVLLLQAMDSQRYVDLLDRLVVAAGDPVFAADDPVGEGPEATRAGPDEPAIEALPRLVRRPWRRLRNAVAALPEVPEDTQLHAVRILAKHTRYAAEAAVGVMGKDASSFGSAVAGLQTVLGDHQDACVTEEWLRASGPTANTTTEAMLIGQLIGLQRSAAAANRADWPAAWARASDKQLRRWMA